MIYTSLANLGFYKLLSSHFADVTTFLKEKDLLFLPNDKIQINNRGCYAVISEYQTKSKDMCFIECHKKYIDIQVVIFGKEFIGICNVAECVALTSYDTEKDFQKMSGSVSFISLTPGNCAIFFPDDGHMPQMATSEGSCMVKKIVVKVPV